jgi:hypothetical protein
MRAQISDERYIHNVEMDVCLFSDFLSYFCFVLMFLSISETEGPYLLESFFCPEETGGGILSATEYDQSFLVVENHGIVDLTVV